MINTGNRSRVLEKTDVMNEAEARFNSQYAERTSGQRSDECSVSNDLMMNFALRGETIEQSLNNQYVEQSPVRDFHITADESPSETTMQFSNDDEFEDELVENKKGYKISSRGKVMITVYAIVIATIIALIAMNARVLKTMEQSIKESQAAVQSLQQQTYALEQELEYVSSEEVISSKAIEMGMTK